MGVRIHLSIIFIHPVFFLYAALLLFRMFLIKGFVLTPLRFSSVPSFFIVFHCFISFSFHCVFSVSFIFKRNKIA